MPKPRNVDRHRPERRAVIWRPNPPDLRDQLDAAVGKGNRGKTLDELVRRFLAGEPMPPKP